MRLCCILKSIWLQDLWDGEVPEENQKIFEAEHKFKK